MAKKKAETKAEEVVEEVVVAEGEETTVPTEMFDGDGNELLFPNGPSINKVEEWKSQFADEVYLSEFDEDIFLWRPITRKEYKEIMKVQNADSFYKEERICEKVVLFPENYNFMTMTQGKAGIPTLLAELVMEKSGFQAKTGAMKL